MFEWLAEGEWYKTVANFFSFIGMIAFFVIFFEQQKKIVVVITVFVLFGLACLFGWLPNVLAFFR